MILFEIGNEALLMTCLLMVLGFMLYWFYGRKKVSRGLDIRAVTERSTREIVDTSAMMA